MFDLSPRILSSEVLLQDILAAVLRQLLDLCSSGRGVTHCTGG
jgi:hypothetical protein